MHSKPVSKIIDSRHLKIIAAKRENLKGALVFICLDEEKYGNLDTSGLRKIAELIDQIEPDGIYFPFTKKMDIKIYDISQFNNKDVLVTISHENIQDINTDEIETSFKKALSGAKSIQFVHTPADIERI